MFPGPHQWELWSLENGEFSLLREDLGKKAGAEKWTTSGPLYMALPLALLTTMPFITPTKDESVLEDIAQLHVEKLGMKPDSQYGSLFDWRWMDSSAQGSLLFTSVLHPLEAEDLPQKSPKQFDSAARCLPLPVNAVTIWKELGKYVFAVTRGEELLFTQCLTSQEVGAVMAQEIQLSLMHLEHQGLLGDSSLKWIYWESENGELSASQIQTLQEASRLFSTQTKPQPLLPETWSMFLPADVEAERTQRQKKKQTVRMFSLLALLYFATVAYFGYELWSARAAAQEATKEYESLEPEAVALQIHNQEWSELLPLVEKEHNPLELLYRCSRALPQRGIRLKDAHTINQLQVGEDGSQRVIRTITLKGEAEDFGTVTAFNKKLENNPLLSVYQWEKTNPIEGKDGRWGFLMNAVFKEGKGANE